MDVARPVVEEVAADEQADAPDGRLERPKIAARGEELGFFEHPVRRKVDLAMDMEEAAVGDESGRVVEEALFRRPLLDEPDDGRKASRAGRDLSEERVRIRVEGDLLDEVLQRVTREAQFGENDQVGLPPARFFEDVQVEFDVGLDVPESRRDLGERDFHGS